MQIDKDDRYVSETSHKSLTPSKGASIFKQLLKPRAMILILVVVLLMLIFIMSLSMDKDDNSWVVPPNVGQTQQSPTTNSLTNTIELKAPTIVSDTSQSSINNSPTSDSASDPQPNLATAKATETKPEQTSTVVTPSTATNQTIVLPKQESKTVPSEKTKPVETVSQTEKKITPPVTSTASAKSVNKESNLFVIANNRFSIQLVASTSLENVKKLKLQYNLKNAHIYETIRNNNPWYVLIQGDYPSIEVAREAIKSLPEEFQKNKAWVKAGTVINKEMSMVQNQPSQE